jgi:3-oxoacyl-[acyl-carrier protein] reductase
MLLKDKTILITGASRGIGKACAEIFASQGASLILMSRNYDALDQLSKELMDRHNTNSKIASVDVKDADAIQEEFRKLRKEKITLDGLVNNAGIMIDATLQMTTTAMINDLYQTNVFGSIYVAKYASKLMLKNRNGSILNLSSIIGTNGNLGQSIYGSSKSAIIGFTKSLSKELASLNIRVNALAPGFIDTDMTSGMDQKFYEKNLSSIGLKRIGTPQDVANVALFLMSDLSSYMTGQILGVDGGMII